MTHKQSIVKNSIFFFMVGLLCLLCFISNYNTEKTDNQPIQNATQNFPIKLFARRLHTHAPRKGLGIKIALIDTGVTSTLLKQLKLYMPSYGCLNMQTKTPTDDMLVYIKKNCDLDADVQILAKLEHELELCAQHYYITRDQNELEQLLQLALHKIARAKKQIRALTIPALTSGLMRIAKAYAHNYSITIVNNYPVIREFLPVSDFDTNILSYMHGSHACSQLAGKYGISPKAEIIIIKAITTTGFGTKALLIKALKKAIALSVDIVILSLKLEDLINPKSDQSRLLESLISHIPYSVASAGNDESRKNKIAYPARFDSITFSIGSYGAHNNTIFVPPYSQYEAGRGPHFLAPGVNVPASGLPAMSGTSCAAVIFGGFLALVLSQTNYKNTNTLSISNAIKKLLINNSTPYQKSLYGIVDMPKVLKNVRASPGQARMKRARTRGREAHNNIKIIKN